MSLLSKLGAGLAVAALAGASIVATADSASAIVDGLDSYAGATVVGTSLTLNVNNAAATTQAGEVTTLTDLAYKHIYSTVWAKWTAPATGTIEADTDGSTAGLDTSLAIFTSAKSISKAKRLAWNDDADTADSVVWSKIEGIAVRKGTTYYFQLGTVSGSTPPATGVIDLTINPKYTQPVNDDLGHAIVESGTSFSIKTGTYGATLESFEQAGPYDSVWYKWIPAASGNVHFDLTGSDGDVYGSLWEQTGSGATPSGELAEVGEWADSTDPFTYPVNPGSTYFLAFGVILGPDGNVRAHITANLTGPIVTKISPASGSIAGGNKITITGKNLGDVNEVDFGSISNDSLNIVHVNSTKITVTVPQVVIKGKVWVQLDTPTTSSVVNTATHYTYK